MIDKYYETNYKGGGQDVSNESQEGIFHSITKNLFNL